MRSSSTSAGCRSCSRPGIATGTCRSRTRAPGPVAARSANRPPTIAPGPAAPGGHERVSLDTPAEARADTLNGATRRGFLQCAVKLAQIAVGRRVAARDRMERCGRSSPGSRSSGEKSPPPVGWRSAQIPFVPLPAIAPANTLPEDAHHCTRSGNPCRLSLGALPRQASVFAKSRQRLRRGAKTKVPARPMRRGVVTVFTILTAMRVDNHRPMID